MTLSTAHIGFAIRDLMENQWIDGEQPSSDNPLADGRYEIYNVDVSDAHNPWLYTSGGVFKIIILKMDPPKQMPKPAPVQAKKLLWEPGQNDGDESSD